MKKLLLITLFCTNANITFCMKPSNRSAGRKLLAAHLPHLDTEKLLRSIEHINFKDSIIDENNHLVSKLLPARIPPLKTYAGVAQAMAARASDGPSLETDERLNEDVRTYLKTITPTVDCIEKVHPFRHRYQGATLNLPFYESIDSDDLDLFYFITHYCNPHENRTAKAQTTHLTWAAEQGAPCIAQHFFHKMPPTPEQASELLLCISEQFTNNPLESDDIKRNFIAEILLTMYSANPNAIDAGGSTVLMNAFNRDNDPLAVMLINHKADVNMLTPDGETALHSVAEHGTVNQAKLLLDHGALVDTQDPQDKTALHIAVYEKKADIVSYLLKHSASVNVQNVINETPLHIAFKRSIFSIIRELLAHNADITLLDNDDNTIEQILARQEILASDADKPHLLKIRRLLEQHKLNQQYEGVARLFEQHELNQQYEGIAQLFEEPKATPSLPAPIA